MTSQKYCFNFSLITASVLFLIVGLLVLMKPAYANSISTGVNDIAGTIGLKEDQAGVEGAKVKTMKIVQIVISYLGIVMMILVLYGGFVWMTAAGSEDRVKKAKEIITAAVIGVLIVVFAYAIVSVVFKIVIKDTQKGAEGVRAQAGETCGPDNAGIECDTGLICRRVFKLIKHQYECTTTREVYARNGEPCGSSAGGISCEPWLKCEDRGPFIGHVCVPK